MQIYERLFVMTFTSSIITKAPLASTLGELIAEHETPLVSINHFELFGKLAEKSANFFNSSHLLAYNLWRKSIC